MAPDEPERVVGRHVVGERRRGGRGARCSARGRLANARAASARASNARRRGLRTLAAAGQATEHRQRRRQEVTVVVPGHDVQRRSHQRRLDDPPLPERAVERCRVERGESRPEREIRRRRLLGLQAADSLDGRSRTDPRALEEKLPGEGGAIEPVPSENLVLRSAHATGSVATGSPGAQRSTARPPGTSR